jgi:hypothetical protein
VERTVLSKHQFKRHLDLENVVENQKLLPLNQRREELLKEVEDLKQLLVLLSRTMLRNKLKI